MLFPPSTSAPAHARKRIYGLPQSPVAITLPPGLSRSLTSSKSGSPALLLALTVSLLRKPCACTPLRWTVRRCASGRFKMAWHTQVRQNVRTPRCGAGSAPRSANSGNWMPHPIVGSPLPPWTFPCSICSMIAAACSLLPSSTIENSFSPTLISYPPLSSTMDDPSKSTSIITPFFSTGIPRL